METELIRRIQLVTPLLRRVGPYVALEIVMPGGTVLALMLYLYQRRRQARAGTAAPLRNPAPQVHAWARRTCARVAARCRSSVDSVRGAARLRAVF